MNKHNKERTILLWFGPKEEIEDPTINESRIIEYNKEYGDMFYIPLGIKDYMKELGWGKQWKKGFEEVMRTFIIERANLYYDRCKEHSKILKAKQLKKEWINGKYLKQINDPLDHIPKKVKYNEIIDLTESIPCIIIDLNTKKRIKIDKPIIITGPLPKMRKRKKE